MEVISTHLGLDIFSKENTTVINVCCLILPIKCVWYHLHIDTESQPVTTVNYVKE
jgi:hypothetical protein